jgi:endonuclease/exonuclease/phosphatase family metal-dependent hydrolase
MGEWTVRGPRSITGMAISPNALTPPTPTEGIMRFATWNVAHQTRRKKELPERIGTALGSIGAEVLVLTEYVANDTHAPFLAALGRAGLSHVRTSTYVQGQNQVLIASRHPMEPGTLTGPADNTSPTRSNLLHVEIPEAGIEVVGMRVPMFKVGQDRQRYWNWFERTVPTLTASPTILLGDFNADPARSRACGGAHLARIEAKNWKVVTPANGWAFKGKTGHTSRIDHGIVSPGCTFSAAEYCTSCGDVALAGAPKEGYSDHALLRFDVSIPKH